MTSEDGKGTMKWLSTSVIVGFVMLVLFVLGLIQSCGSRKVETQISKTETKVKEESKDTGSQSNQTESSTKVIEAEKNDKVEENLTRRVEELYNENGQLIKRITELTNNKSTDKSTKDKSFLNSLISFEYKTWVKTYYKTITIRIKEKSKETKANNNAFYIVIGVLGALAIVLGYLYYNARSRLKNEVGFLG